jgi:roadblock/LC7 domain-containing protein
MPLESEMSKKIIAANPGFTVLYAEGITGVLEIRAELPVVGWCVYEDDLVSPVCPDHGVIPAEEEDHTYYFYKTLHEGRPIDSESVSEWQDRCTRRIGTKSGK